jgi:PAS domain S-box-containing protein
MSEQIHDSAFLDGDAGKAEAITEVRREAALLKTGALQNAIFNSANFSSIATDEKGVIQLFNVGAERMLGYAAADVLDKITPADISDPQEVIARAKALSLELATPITPGFEALVFKASRGIEDIYELTYIRKDGSRFPAVVSVTGYATMPMPSSAICSSAPTTPHENRSKPSRRSSISACATSSSTRALSSNPTSTRS